MAEAKPKSAPEQDPSMEEILQSIRKIIAEDDKDAPATGGGKSKADEPNTSSMDISSDVLELTEAVTDETPVSAAQGDKIEAEDAASGKPADILASIDNALADDIPEPTTAPLADDDFGMVEDDQPMQIIPAATPAAMSQEMLVQKFETEELPAIPGSDLSIGRVKKPENIAGSDLSIGLEKAPDRVSGSTLLSEQTAAVAGASIRKLSQTKNKQSPVSDLAFRSGITVEDLVIEAITPMLKDWLDTNLAIIVERIVEREVKRLASEN